MAYEIGDRDKRAILEHIVFHLRPNRLRGSHVVAFVDDDPQVLEALGRTLRGEPYVQLSTTVPEDALGWVGRESVSVFVTDQFMPGITGTELLRQVRRRSPTTLRVLLTAYPGGSPIKSGLEGAVDWLISKPWNDQALRMTLLHLLHKRESRIGGKSHEMRGHAVDHALTQT